MRTLKLLAALLLVSPAAFAASPNELAASMLLTEPIALNAGDINNIYLYNGIITTLKFDGAKPIDRVLIGSPIFEVQADEKLGRLNLVPLQESGATNMIVTIGGVDYVFIVQITTSKKQVIYTRTYQVGNLRKEGLIGDLQRLAGAPVMKPGELDPVRIGNVIERARKDAIFRRSLSDYRQVPLARHYSWNGCIIHLTEVNAFLDSDLLVFRVQWVNTSGYGIYLNPRQVGITAAGQPIEIRASAHDADAQDDVIEPGQLDTLWIVVQGKRYAYENDWELSLPPQARSVRSALAK